MTTRKPQSFDRLADKRNKVVRVRRVAPRAKLIITQAEHAEAKNLIQELKRKAGPLKGRQHGIFEFLASEILGAQRFELKECANRINSGKIPDAAKNILHDLAVARYHHLKGK